MKASLKRVSDIIAQANDLFYQKNNTIDTIIGIMDKSLRQQGMNADAISIECIPLNKKIVFLIHDDNPEIINIALGNKVGDISSTKQLSFDQLSVDKTVEYMQQYFC